MGFLSKLFGIKKSNFDYVKILPLIKEGAFVIDVRTEREFDEGNIEGSENFSLQELKQNVEIIKAKNKIIIAYCRSGNRSEMATKILNRKGVETYNGGGYMEFDAKLKEAN